MDRQAQTRGGVLCAANSQILSYLKPAVIERFPGAEIEFMPAEEMRSDAVRRLKSIRARRYDAVIFGCWDQDVQIGIDKWKAYLLLTAAKKKLIVDLQGRESSAGWLNSLLVGFPHIILERLAAPFVVRKIAKRIGRLLGGEKKRARLRQSIDSLKKVCFLRTDLCFGVKAGGSVTHIAGVAQGFKESAVDLFFVSTDKLELVDEAATPIHIFKPQGFFRNMSDISHLTYNDLLVKRASALIGSEKPDLIYQRYSIFNFSGLMLARRQGLPFVLEYNGSEVWIAKNWGAPLKNQDIAEKIELFNLIGADLVVVVSEASKEDLIKLGVEENKILVNPNGVDTDRVHPDIDGSEVRSQYGLEDKLVIGFVGTFGKWHGAEVLAQAVKPISEKLPSAQVVFIGDGLTMQAVKAALRENNVEKFATITGMVPQPKGPEYLAACDILVSPHVANADGTRFFGSPTKLFEYMAMGKPIVASNLEQIGEILTHDRNAILVEPGNVEQLARGIIMLAGDSALRERLGRQARQDVLGRYTWRHNVQHVIENLVTKRDLKEIYAHSSRGEHIGL